MIGETRREFIGGILSTLGLSALSQSGTEDENVDGDVQLDDNPEPSSTAVDTENGLEGQYGMGFLSMTELSGEDLEKEL